MLLKMLIVSPEKFERLHYENDDLKTKASTEIRIPLKKKKKDCVSVQGAGQFGRGTRPHTQTGSEEQALHHTPDLRKFGRRSRRSY